jgi:hypothetical protein
VAQHDGGQDLDVVAHGRDLIEDPSLLGGEEFEG